jgi:PilZ domain
MASPHNLHSTNQAAPYVVLGSAEQIDLRREPRYPVFWRARVLLPEGRTVDARTRDISHSGVALMVGELLPRSCALSLTLMVPDPTYVSPPQALMFRINAVSVVLTGQEYRIGCTWVDVTREARQLIDGWIRRLRQAL